MEMRLSPIGLERKLTTPVSSDGGNHGDCMVHILHVNGPFEKARQSGKKAKRTQPVL
jgi:hypothetical protein